MYRAEKEDVNGVTGKARMDIEPSPPRRTVLVATIDPAIRSGLAELFQAFHFNTIWLQGVEAAKSKLAKGRIDACLCGLWLQDGTYRELVRHIRRERVDIPVVIVSGPACPEEYRDYLAATKIGALDFLCYPYRKTDLQRMLSIPMESDTRPISEPANLTGDLQTGEAEAA